MTDIYDISSIPARFAAEVTRGADKIIAQRTELQNRRAAMSTLPEEAPDYAEENIRIDCAADVTRLPAGVFTGTITGRDYVDPALLAKLCEGGMV